MSDNTDLISALGQLSQPATLLVQKISDAVGGIFLPYQMVRVAHAEAEADRIRAESQIQVTDLHRRAMHRFLEEEAIKQRNIEGITKQALPLLNQTADPGKVEDDWITNFFDKCRIVSNRDMQQLWSQILAREANQPGAFSRKTVNLLADMDKRDAELFSRLCGFCWEIQIPSLVILDCRETVYQAQGINFNSLSQLQNLGLIRFDAMAGFRRMRLPRRLAVSYFGRQVDLTFPKDRHNTLNLGQALLTQAGDELWPVCGARPALGFYQYVYDKWAAQSLVPPRPSGGRAAAPATRPEPA